MVCSGVSVCGVFVQIESSTKNTACNGKVSHKVLTGQSYLIGVHFAKVDQCSPNHDFGYKKYTES